MTPESDGMRRLRLLLEILRSEVEAAGWHRELDELVQRYRSDGTWPFDHDREPDPR
ncbi:hypothetical protein [Amnibacterium sp.]|uniref:hypothetical protein n=1 Tax=Amnibacterium sp. TaxID=1872496 RepID=UPI003F7BF333